VFLSNATNRAKVGVNNWRLTLFEVLLSSSTLHGISDLTVSQETMLDVTIC